MDPGVDPSPVPSLVPHPVPSPASARPPTRPPHPAGDPGPDLDRCPVPSPPSDFTGRTPELVRLRALARAAANGSGGTVTIATASGQPGLGKTSLALRVIRDCADRFPDGSFHLDLQGADERPLPPEEGLTRLLRALGVPEARIPLDVDERGGLYRSLVHDRRMVILLDNAADERQVRPLLPGGPHCLVLVTSRRALPRLETTERILLQVMPPVDSVRLLRRIAGRRRTAAELQATAELAELCGHLPLALRIAGNRLSAGPGAVGRLVTLLRQEEHRLDALGYGDQHIRVAFSLSYRQMPPEARRMFRLLALAPGPDFGPELAAVLTGADLGTAEAVLDELADAGMLEPAPTTFRYRFHDLIRLFAAEALREDEPSERQTAAESCMVDHFLRRATDAGLLFHPGKAGSGERVRAQNWLGAEFPAWAEAVRIAAGRGLHRQVVDLAEAMHWFSDYRRFHPGWWAELFSLGLDAARALDSRPEEVVQLNYLSWALGFYAGRYAEAAARADEALALARTLGDRKEEAWALLYRAAAQLRGGDPAAAAPNYHEASAVMARLGDTTGEDQSLRQYGVALRLTGDPAGAIAVHRTVLARFQDPARHPDEDMRAVGTSATLTELGHDSVSLNRWREAADSYRSALPLIRSAGVRWQEAGVLRALGTALCELHDPEAADCLSRAADMFAELGDSRQRAEVVALLERLSSAR